MAQITHAPGGTGAAPRAEWLVIGAGPCGLAAVDQLLAAGVRAEDVTVVAPASTDAPGGVEQRSATLQSSYASALQSGAMGKTVDGQTVSIEAAAAAGSLSQHWGASCLPLPAGAVGAQDPRYLAAYDRTVRDWNVSAEDDALTAVYPITGERVGRLPRKQLARAVVDAAPQQVVGHSRLAVRSGGSQDERACTGASLCFHGCPQRSPWQAQEALTARTGAGGAHVLHGTASGLEALPGGATRVYVGGRAVDAERVLVATGWRSTTTLLGGAPPSLGADADVEQSTVVMAPVLFRKGSSEGDYAGTFTYHDLVVPHRDAVGSLEALTQVYLPTHELSGRMLAALPRLAAPVLRGAVARPRASAPLERMLRHVGVAMTFLPGHRDWTSTRSDEAAWKAHVPGDVGRALAAVGGRVLPVNRVVLGNGQSQHVGAWKPYAHVTRQLLAGDRVDIPPSAGGARVAAADPCLLATLEPGPHTATAAAMTRLLVDALVDQW